MGTKKIYYRADHRDFEPCDEMPPGEEDYITGLNPNHRAVEDMIRSSIPDGAAIRGKSLHVFEDLKVAKNYWLPFGGSQRAAFLRSRSRYRRYPSFGRHDFVQ
jgi:hypothetical protein